MHKILKPYTIIPSDLYIERDADRQVDNIIRDMGRPGYVLVSRQMGKTNLLLNAKRRLENINDIFAYIDLSNPFDDLKNCFENIVDTILDTNEERLSAVIEKIKNHRVQQKDTPPFKQHINELRLILKQINGKLVIILDEIDALTKKAYSDQIFAQIRSIYFSRANYAELERLTYILSGVVEPNEIIKDPKISPFNIGEKIFLNDFSKKEFELFITKSKLSLSEEVKNRIFLWTDGNPRITWDVCSEIEDKFRDKELNVKDIDDLISEMYLTTFDRPPVDNIRELVKKDRELRNAIIEISYNKGNEISDKIKSKLYLSGITNYNGNNDIHIKNEILKESLSIDWIREVEEEDKGLIKLALEFHEKENYSEALYYFEKFLENNQFEPTVESLYYYYMGSAEFHLSNLKKSLEYLNLTKFKKSTPEEAFYYWTLNLKGLTSFYLGEIEDSLDYLQQIIGDHKEDESYTQAVLNYGVFSRNSGIEKYEKVSITFFEKIINEIGYKNEKLSDDFLNEVKSIAYYNIAQIHAKAEHFEKAIENYEHSLSIARLEVKPILLLGLYYIEEKNTRKEEIIAEIVNIIKENNLQPIEFDIDKQLDFNTEQLQEILTITFIHSYSEFEKLKPWLQFLGEKTYAEYIYELFLFSISHKQDWNTGFALLSNIYDNFDNREYGIDEKIKYNTLQILAYIDAEKSEEYISLFSVRRLKKIDYIDFSIFANLITGLIEQKKYDDSLKYIQVINSVKNEVDNELIINYLSILNLELNTYYLLKENDTAIEKAKEILTLCNDTTIKKQKSNLLGDKGLEIVRKNAEAILYTQSRNQHPIRVEKKYGPNEWVKVRYTDGRIENKKYKKVKDDLNNNKCTIITNE